LNQSPTLTFTFYLPLLNSVANKNYSDYIYIYMCVCVCVYVCEHVCVTKYKQHGIVFYNVIE